ncbi:MAG: winged helix-turn-helix transcriptional regulator [Ectothiorhodospiraceae bacterium]|nr:winged helix-turn-helix transcriptional regulator [Ectothiorhodospiraceae bacterium]
MNAEDHAAKPRPARPELDLNQFLPYRLSNLADRVSQGLSTIYSARFGISIPEWRVLAWISHKDVLTAKQISEFTRMDKARVSRAVNALERRGLISRTPSDDDQRVQFLRLTGQGETLLAELIPEAHAWEARVVATLSAAEYRDLFNIIAKLERQLTRIDQR